MSISIQTTDDGVTVIEDAREYHVDELGFLHIRGTKTGNIATFHANRWQAVIKN